MNNYFWGLICVLGFVICDYTLGVIRAIMQKNLSSSKMREGLAHKFAYLATLFVAWFIDFMKPHIDLGFSISLFVPVVVGISLIELTSIIENICDINPELKENKILSIFDRKEK